MISALIDGAIKRRKVVLGIALIATLFGFFAYRDMPREAAPEIDIPFVVVVVPFPGVSPEDAERLLVKPHELQMQNLEGLKEMTAVARENAAVIELEFNPDFNKERALADVRAKVDLARARFPPDAEQPQIEEASTALDPVIGIVLHGQAPERELFRVSRDLKERLETLPNVLSAEVSGAREEMMEVTIDPVRMAAQGVTAPQINQALANVSLDAAGGRVQVGDR